MAHRFATKVIVQSEALKSRWHHAEVCDQLKVLGAGRPEKEPLVFVTVGTVMPFDRLVKGVESLRKQGLLPERVIAQVGDGGDGPEGGEVQEGLAFPAVRAKLAKDN